MRKRFVFTCVALVGLLVGTAAPSFAQAQSGPLPPGALGTVQTPVERADAATNVQHSHSSAATLTITAGAAGTNTQSVYITGIDISNCAGASAVTAAAPTYITTTGINGSPQYQVGSGVTAGLCTQWTVMADSAPLKSSTPGTNVTLVLPTFATNQTISVNVKYRLGY